MPIWFAYLTILPGSAAGAAAPYNKKISQPDATCFQDLDEEEWPTFHATGKHFGFMPPPLVRTHSTDHQPYYKVLHQPTSVHIRRCHLPL